MMGEMMMKFGRILLPAAGVILLLGLVIFFALNGGGAGSSDLVSEGIRYLKALESSDMTAIESTLAAQRQAKLDAEREQRMAELTNGEVDVWSLFNDYVLLGDSRGVGFYYYGFMPESRVIAGGGWTIRDIADHMDSVRALNPTSIFLCFGLNDTSIGYWNTPEEYAAEYEQVVAGLYEEFPNATVYVNSTLPVTEAGYAIAEKWREIPDYNAKVQEMCEKNGYAFVNNDKLAEEHMDLWDPDSIHLQKEFYPYWAANMMMTVYDYGRESGGE